MSYSLLWAGSTTGSNSASCLAFGVSVFTTEQQVQTWQAAGVPADLSDDAASTPSAALQSAAGTILQCAACRTHIK